MKKIIKSYKMTAIAIVFCGSKEWVLIRKSAVEFGLPECHSWEREREREREK